MTRYAFMSIAYGGEGNFLMLLKDYLPVVTQCSEGSILRHPDLPIERLTNQWLVGMEMGFNPTRSFTSA
jgi:hypothetical protein